MRGQMVMYEIFRNITPTPAAPHCPKKQCLHSTSPPLTRDALSICLPVWLARGCSCKARAGFPGRREERAWARKRGARWLQLGRVPEKTRASGRARTHLHTLQSRRARAAAAPARRVADSCCNSVCSGPEEGKRSGAPGTLRKARAGVGACGHGVRVAPGHGRVRAPAALLATGPTLAGRLCSAAASSAAAGQRCDVGLGGSGTAAKTLQVAGCARPATRNFPLVQAAKENAFLLTSGAAFCSLWFGPEPTWSCGHREGWWGGGEQEEGEGVSLPHRPPPGKHAAALSRTREGTPRWPHNKG